MKRGVLWHVSILTSSQAEDAVMELLERFFGVPASSYTRVETGVTTVTVYLEQEPLGWKAKRTELAARLKAGGVNAARAKIGLARISQEDWAESWKRHFAPIEIRPALLIKPSWSKRRARKGQAEVVLDPGLSFGTGQHPTTAFCLRQLVARRRLGESQSFLDLGTGSGILAIAAIKLGYGPVQALDFDSEAVRMAGANARKNHASRGIHFLRQDVAKLRGRAARKYSVVCANLISNVLLAAREPIVARLDKRGVLVLAGILRAEFPRVQQAYETAGLRLVRRRVEKEWCSGAFAWRA